MVHTQSTAHASCLRILCATVSRRRRVQHVHLQRRRSERLPIFDRSRVTILVNVNHSANMLRCEFITRETVQGCCDALDSVPRDIRRRTV
jgi:hypothetical protein